MPSKNQKSISAEQTIQLLSGFEHGKIKEMFENIGIYALLSYKKDGKILIPFVGEVDTQNDGSGLRYSFTPSQFLVRNIGQIENGEESEFDGTLARRFKHVLSPREREPRKYKKSGTLVQETAADQEQDGLI